LRSDVVAIIVGVIVIVLLASFIALNPQIPINNHPQPTTGPIVGHGPTPTPVPLAAQEVRNYNGTPLSPIAGVYENAIRGTQYINVSTYKLSIYGLVNKSIDLTYNDVISNNTSYQKVVTIYCVEGWNAVILWQGVLVKDLIADAGGADPSADTVIFHASDGYTTALPLSYIVNNNILLAYEMNNLTIPADRGFPFELVAQSQLGYKWIKWVTGIEVSSNSGYLGYWESRGYPNDATIPSG
jgi:DMSO/TMAO reductase YedYZ molybdopterin-dependent catalytic subunit